MRTILAPVFVAVLLMSTGCAKQAQDLEPVSGRLLLDGSPLPGKRIFFHPEPGTLGLGAGCHADGEGNFEVVAIVGGALRAMKGARIGRYRVTVVDASHADEATANTARSTSSRRVATPSRYGSSETTPLRVEVTRGMSEVVLELKTR